VSQTLEGHDASPFHAGEQRVQERMGVREEIEPWARKVVRNQLPEQHREFYAALPYLAVAARDENGRPWATLLARAPGFVRSPDPAHLTIDALPAPGDALAKAFSEGADVGLLGIELHTRRRNRVNGRVATSQSDGFTLAVEQAYGNCPQYIHERRWRAAPADARATAARHQDRLPEHLVRWIETADTFFIASGYRGDGESPTFGMDASHRGGAPGFVRVENARRIVFPDYAGNDHFNTIGNLFLDPRAGYLFVDFERGGLLQLTGRTSIDWDSPAVSRFPGARRLVSLELDEAIEITGALPLRWETPTGSVRELRLVAKQRESDAVMSFSFESRDGGELPGFRAGQHLPIEIEIPGQTAATARSYSLSGSPEDARYRISVKREAMGLASRHLHDHLDVGGIIGSRDPKGEFVLEGCQGRPVVFVSAGVGLTPLVSMLHAIAACGDPRPVWFVYGARDARQHPLRDEVRRLVAALPSARLHVAYSRPRPDDTAGTDFDSAGRIDAALLASLLSDLDADFYLCGPVGFMATVQQDLENRGVAPDRIRTESFGPRG
jgi:ferredoxin-NADP reductase/predicted pyridoxine 5'-phosphate oxidase superfamily flavin-nucleotide-binding protein